MKRGERVRASVRTRVRTRTYDRLIPSYARSTREETPMSDAKESEVAAGAAGVVALPRTEMDSGSKEREIRERGRGREEEEKEEGVCVSPR